LRQLSPQLRLAYEDYKYLLDRGYNRKPALDLVSARYGLSREERLLLYRCVHSEAELREILSKLVENPKRVAVDGYNIALTMISLMSGEAFECDDGFFRDVNLGKRKGDDRVRESLIEACNFLISKGIEPLFLLDYQISGSGELAAELRKEGCNALAVRNADKESIMSAEAVASNDFVVLMRAKVIYNLLKAMGFRAENLASILGVKRDTLSRSLS
jgi:hypothetical protein